MTKPEVNLYAHRVFPDRRVFDLSGSSSKGFPLPSIMIGVALSATVSAFSRERVQRVICSLPACHWRQLDKADRLSE